MGNPRIARFGVPKATVSFARHAINLNEALHYLALQNTCEVLGSGPAFDLVVRDSSTCASAARQICATLQEDAA